MQAGLTQGRRTILSDRARSCTGGSDGRRNGDIKREKAGDAGGRLVWGCVVKMGTVDERANNNNERSKEASLVSRLKAKRKVDNERTGVEEEDGEAGGGGEDVRKVWASNPGELAAAEK